ncbi:MAG: HXXEE domain-containing protein [Methanobacterium sp.]|nr:HXXEE domain-containing protein [Methanobacterium sp.]
MNLTILWLIPVAYFVHILEESPRFVPWAMKYFGAPETFGQFIIGNIIFMAYVIVATSLAILYPNEWTLILGLSAAAWIFSNFLIHAYYTLRTGIYSPGVVTAGAIYVPVSVYIYSNFWVSGLLSNLDIALSIVIGFAIMYVPTLIQKKRKGKF